MYFCLRFLIITSMQQKHELQFQQINSSMYVILCHLTFTRASSYKCFAFTPSFNTEGCLHRTSLSSPRKRKGYRFRRFGLVPPEKEEVTGSVGYRVSFYVPRAADIGTNFLSTPDWNICHQLSERPSPLFMMGLLLNS